MTDKERTIAVRTKSVHGKTVTSYVDAPLCEHCNGSGIVPYKGDIFDTCPSCKGLGQFKRASGVYPQIEDWQ